MPPPAHPTSTLSTDPRHGNSTPPTGLNTLLATMALATATLPAIAQDSTPAHRDPGSNIGRQHREHSGNSQEVMQRHYGAGQTYFRGAPSPSIVSYGATLLPYTLPAGHYTNRASFALQLSVQAIPNPTQKPCYDASVRVNMQTLGTATGENCNSTITSFNVTVPAGATFSMLNANAQVTALATGPHANWQSTSIRFDVESQVVDNSGCAPPKYTGQQSLRITDNLGSTRHNSQACPETLLSPQLPPGTHYGSLENSLLLQIQPNTHPKSAYCYDLTVFNPDTYETVLRIAQPHPCPPPLDNHLVMIPPWTRFGLSGGTAQVRLMGLTNGNWRHTAIVFPVKLLAQERSPCTYSATNGYTQTVSSRYLSNIQTEWTQKLQEPCTP